MTDTDFGRLSISRDHGVSTITIDNPPVNVLDVSLMSEISRFLVAVRDDPDTRVLVFQSANPEFFIAHVDMTLIDEPHAFDELARHAPEGLNPFQAFGELLREQPQVTIVKLAGLARGGGATQYLTSRMTRGRALEAILGAELIDAATAERYGWINRALPAAELDDFVDRLARNIAALPEGVIAAAKQAMPAPDLREGFYREHDAWAGLFARPAAEKLIRGGLKAGAQTRAGERNLEGLLRGLEI
ncbi:enoyl-CoA hydratase/isomerase family protein [Serratia sp. NFX21]|uniref:enoyl-CoA hydratase/isomerase family protein n=1 Tax=Serratia sp. NFX21 TaxID=3402279 RepID=UPI003AF3CAA7